MLAVQRALAWLKLSESDKVRDDLTTLRQSRYLSVKDTGEDVIPESMQLIPGRTPQEYNQPYTLPEEGKAYNLGNDSELTQEKGASYAIHV
jgi:hypothetical protein